MIQANRFALFLVIVMIVFSVILFNFISEEMERWEPEEMHLHQMQPIPYGQGLKTVYVRVCLTDSMLVDANGNHHNKERFKQITQ